MKSLFTSKLVIITTAALVTILALVFAYYGWLLPKKQQNEQLEAQVKSAKQMLVTLQQKQTETKNIVNESTKRIQLQLPVKALDDQFLLDLQKAELKSSSTIQSINITDGKPQQTVEQRLKDESTFKYGPNGGAGSGQASPNANAQATSNTSTSADKKQNGSPDSLKAMTYNLKVNSPNYESFTSFLGGLESLDRITSIDTLTFTGDPETATGKGTDQMNYSLAVSTYYVPQLTDLIKDVPVVEYPKPQKKDNPLYPGGQVHEVQSNP
jgi:type IV pilus assembly protein PilO